MVSDEEKIAWVFGYFKANFDMFAQAGNDPEKLGASFEFITNKTLARLGIKDQTEINRVINNIQEMDLELTINKVIRENIPSTDGKKFSFTI